MTGQDVGVIIPPPEIRVMIDKTANFVASNGAKLEKKVFASLNANPKFSFILPTDNYHSYYRQQLEKALEANKEYKIEDDDDEEEDEKSLLASSSGINNSAPPEPPKPDSFLTKKEEERKSLLDKLRSGKPTQTAPEQPPKPLFVLNIPYTQITALDLDIIKLTAQFVARNGDQFRGGLLNREMRNPQFDFMKVGHHANALFNSLVDTYQRVLYPPRDIVDQLSKTLNNKSSFLEGLLKKAEWEKYVIQSEKLNDPDKEEQSRAPIDWHSFIIVETITFEENEVLPAPISFTQPNQADQNDDMEMDMEDSETSIPHHPIERKVVKNYQPSFERNKRSNAFQKCTICGQDIPLDEFDEHVKIELLDPRFAVQRKSNAEKVLNSSLAQPTSIVKRLEELQYHRTDIFGDDEVEIGKTIEGEDRPKLSEKNIWDGHTASARSAIPSAQLAGKTIQEQIEAIHEAKGIKGDKPEVGPIIRPIVGPPVMNLGQHPQHPSHLLPDPSRMGYQMPGMPFMPYQMPGMPQMPTLPLTPVVAHDPYPLLSSDEPPFKKQKPLEWSDHLIPEAEFLSSHPEPVLLKIFVPKQENKQGWLLDGQTIEISINPSESVGQLKSTIAEKLNGLPANKQNLRVENMPFLKDKDSLAFYNLDESKEITLGLKERGKRKK